MGSPAHSPKDPAEELLAYARKLHVGSIRVVAAELRYDEDASGATAAYFDLTLADPPDDAETWPLNDVLDLHRRIDDKAVELRLPTSWQVTLQAQTPEEFDDDGL